MRYIAKASLVVVAIVTSACYHAVIDTGRPSSGQVIEKPWASSFIAGLVPPSVVETASKCPNGVAKVETQLSFLNQLVSGLTFGIYTPMEIRVECASRGTSMLPAAATIAIDGGASATERAAALDAAAARSGALGTPVYVKF
ncbi:MAG: hypothetical protein NVS4B3_10980 [Gemmatimonadaceae bacterium]